jgi:L-ascorbate metabolism protein UlaG (beta-lactamase superfamily)
MKPLSYTWLGHASTIIELGGRRILTDPALEERIGIGRGKLKFGPRRHTPPAVGPSGLPPLDLLLLSHAHMDHTDLGTLARLPRSLPAIVHRGNRDLVRRFRDVQELDWGEAVTLDGITITSVPVRHWGARTVVDRDRGYGGYLLESGPHRVLFAGDTAYTDALDPLGISAPVTLAILPIGAYDPWIDNHASPEQAWSMATAMRAQWVAPVHHSTFRLSAEPMHEPLERFLAAAGPKAGRVVGQRIGERWELPAS